MCTVLLRHSPGGRHPLLLAAVRDEFVARAFDPPARHWGDRLVGGRDRVAGGTWLAVDPAAPAVAAVLNGVRRAVPDERRVSRGGLPLAVLRHGTLPPVGDLDRYDGFHLLLATPERAAVWTWDGAAFRALRLPPGDHMIVNQGVDVAELPNVAHFLPRLRAVPTPDPAPGLPVQRAWAGWAELMRGDGLDPADPAALLIARSYAGHAYGSTSAALVALGDGSARYDYTTDPTAPGSWQEIALS